MGSDALKNQRVLERVSTPEVTQEGAIDAAVRVATQVAAGMVEPQHTTVQVDRADIVELGRPKVDLHPDGRVTSEQEVTLQIKVRLKSGARLALGASSSFHVDDVTVTGEPETKGGAR